MKKIKGLLTVCCVCIVCLLLLTACSAKLSAPNVFRLDAETLTLSWNKVIGATSYVIQIGDGAPVTTQKTSYSLENLEPGEYVIKVQAICQTKEYEDSIPAEYEFVREVESGLRYKLNSTRDSYTLIGIGKASGDVVMDDYYRGKPVTAIGKTALRRCNTITSFVVGKNVTKIEDNAFYACANLVSVTLPEGLQSIGEGAFQSCSKLESITIPSTVTEIKSYTFSMCNSLKSATIGTGVATLGSYAFSDCVSLESMDLPDSVVLLDEYCFSGCNALSSVSFGNGVKAINKSAFYRCESLRSVQFGESLQTIGESAFQGCGLTELTIPNSVTEIGRMAFVNCTELNSCTLGTGLHTIGYAAFTDTGLMNNCTEDLLIVDGWLLQVMNMEMEELSLDEDVIAVANNAGAYCESLVKIYLPGVRYIGDQAFVRCGNMMEAMFGDALERIGSYAFFECKFLDRVILGGNVKEIRDHAFRYCERLEDSGIDLPKTLEVLGYGVFFNTMLSSRSSEEIVYVDDWVVGIKDGLQLSSAFIKEGTRGICNYAFSKAVFADGTLFIPDSVEIIGKGAFYANPYLALTNFPANLKYIGDYAFSNCSSIMFGELGEAYIPEGCEYLGHYAFTKCAKLLSVSIPSTVKHIGNYAFKDCQYLGAEVVVVDEYGGEMPYTGQVILSEGLESIGTRAFQNCIYMVSVDLPDSLKTMESHAFYKCGALRQISFGTGLESIAQYTFYNCASLLQIHIPGNVRSIGKYAFRGCEDATEIYLGDGVQRIEDYAFVMCSSVQVLSIADSVTSIGSFAFRGMTEMKSIGLSANVTSIGRLAFYGATEATIYYEGTSIPAEWNVRWNATYLPVVLGAVLSDDNSEVISWTAVENGLLNLSGYTQLTAPGKVGYDFQGWSTTENSETSQYASLSDVPVGTTVYPVWTEAEYIPETPEQPETGDNTGK